VSVPQVCGGSWPWAKSRNQKSCHGHRPSSTVAVD
jgi:hypothetical protein